MTCREFLARYSEYLDERVGPVEAERWRSHAISCRSCARYDRVLRDGLERVRELPDVEPSSDFLPRLQHRLYHLHDADLESGNRASGGSAAVALAVAAILTLLAWSPLIRSQVGGSAADRAADAEVDGAEARGAEEAEPAAGPDVPALSPSAVEPYGPPTWADGFGDRRRMVGRDVMLERVWRSPERRGALRLSWPQRIGPAYSTVTFGATRFTAAGLGPDDVSRFFASPEFGFVGFGSARLGPTGLIRSYSPLVIDPTAFGGADGQWITPPAARADAPAVR